MKGNVWGKGEVTEFFKKKINSPFLNSLLDRTVATYSCLPEAQEGPGPGDHTPIALRAKSNWGEAGRSS